MSAAARLLRSDREGRGGPGGGDPRAVRGAQVDADDRAHPRGAGGADHLRAQARRCGWPNSSAIETPGPGAGERVRGHGLGAGRQLRDRRPAGRGVRLPAARPRSCRRRPARSCSGTGTRTTSPRWPSSPGSLERFATEVRNLQRTEILEVEEPFRKGQRGLLLHAAQAQPDDLRARHRAGADRAVLRDAGAGEHGDVARARPDQLQRRAAHPPGREHAHRLHAAQVHRRGRGDGRLSREHAGQPGRSSRAWSCPST